MALNHFIRQDGGAASKRQAVDYQEWTLTIAGSNYADWSESSVGDHERPTGSYAQNGGTIVTKSRTVAGATHTFTKLYNRGEFNRLTAAFKAGNDEVEGVHHEVDINGAVVATLSRITGVMNVRPKVADRQESSGESLTMTVSVVADGAIR